MPTFTAKRTVYPYVILHEASYYSLEEAKTEETGRFFKLMSSMLFSSFCIEGYLNFLGNSTIPDWSRKERRLGRDGRLKIILQHLHMRPNMAHRPFKTYAEVFVFRDALVHSHVVELTATGSLKSTERRPPRPLAKWEKIVTLSAAQRYFDDTNKVILTMHRNAGYSDDPFATPWKAKWEVSP
jgi:hypothetical protein